MVDDRTGLCCASHVRRALVPTSVVLLFLACSSGDDASPGATTTSSSTTTTTSSTTTSSSTSTTTTSSSSTTTERPPPAGFEEICAGRDPGKRTPAKAGALSGTYKGTIKDDGGKPFPVGTMETMKVVPEQPFLVKTIRVAFGKGAGKARIHLMKTFGRSYPGTWPGSKQAGKHPPSQYPDYDPQHEDLVPPVDIDVAEDGPDHWIEIDVSAAKAVLSPSQHYMIVYEHLDAMPVLAVETDPSGAPSRAILFVPTEELPFAISNPDAPMSYRMELAGETFCEWSDDDRWFGRVDGLPFAQKGGSHALVADLDGDGHDDVVTNDGTPHAFLGDGKGGLVAAPDGAFPAGLVAGTTIFADLDNDGDRDAFAANQIQSDADGDGHYVQADDCNDADPNVNPNAQEVPNGYDDDCDGIADDGKDTSDADKDGVSIADGDCDDTRPEVHPGAPEILDSRDNDCDSKVDEDFYNRVLLNDGKAHFTELVGSGLEMIAGTAAVSSGDGDGDGVLDLYVGNWLKHYPDDAADPSHYFRGLGEGKFADVTDASGMTMAKPRPVYGVEFVDYDNDGKQDIYVGNYHMQDNVLWHNLGGGKFEDVALALGVAHDGIKSPYPQWPGGHSYGADFGDFDNDGDMDFYLANLAHPRVMPWSDPSQFFVNQGPPNFAFVDKKREAGFVYDEGDNNCQFGDFDNDMDLDLVVTGFYDTHVSRLYRNDGNGKFTDVTFQANIGVAAGGTAVWADLDEDGSLDLVQGYGLSPFVAVHRNRIGAKHGSVEFDLVGQKGKGGASNRDAVGARVTLTAAGVKQLRDVRGGGGGGGNQGTHLLHFGLGDAKAVDEVTVQWAGGAKETFTGVTPGGLYRLVEGAGKAVKVR